MATIAVNIVLEKLASLAAEEARLLGGVRTGIDQLRDDLDSMKAFLQDAEARSRNDEGLKTWVKQVRDVAYDAEDAIEEFLLHFARPSQHGFINSVQSFYHHIKRLKARHQLAVQIESIKTRVEAISKRRTAFSFNISGATSSDNTLYTGHDLRRASLYLDEADVVGIENPKSLLVTWLVEGERKLTAISVVGMGGLGKTTLVKKAFDCEPVSRSFDCHAWVTVSKSFTIVELLRAALLNFLKATKEPAPEGIESMVDFQLIQLLRTYLQQKRYVIVFDDVWSIDVWEAVKYALPDCNCGSRIIFTTRLIDVAETIENTSHVYHLQPLHDKEAWTLFCMKAFRREVNGTCPEELKAMSKSILKKCEGLPLAIVAIGGLLSKKYKTVSEWKKVHDSLAAEMKRDGNLGSLERILLLSYNDLPYNLKMCYLYLSVFPEDYLIKRTKLIRLWSVERFVEGKRGLTLEEVAEDYLNELVNRSMVQVVEMDHFGRVRNFRVHDILREIIQRKSSEESLVMVASEKTMTEREKVRRLSIHGNCSDSLSDTRFRYLRSLLLFVPIGTATSLGCSFFSGFKLLHVLELEGAPLSIFPPDLIKLVHLRYLSLRGTQVQDIPKSIQKLKQLETLDLKRTTVSSLPVEILQLTRLREVRIYHYRFESSAFLADSYGITVPSGIGSLTSLRTLGTVQVSRGDGKLVRELGQLTQLKRLGIIGLDRENGRDLCYCLERLKHLTSLYMVSARSSDSLQLDSMLSPPGPPKFLQHLFLKCTLETMPSWVASLDYLTKLVLERSKLKSDPLHALQELPSLVVLELRQAYDGEELCCEAKGFPRLKKLCLHELDNVKHVRFAKGAMPELSELNIVACRELTATPLGTEHLYKLKLLLLWDMPWRFLMRIKRSDGEDFWKVQHIKTISRIYESGGRWATETL